MVSVDDAYLKSLRISCRFTISTNSRSVPVALARKRKKARGKGVNPNMFSNEVNGITMPAMTTAIVVAVKARLGRLRKELPAVRMMKMIHVESARVV